MEHLYVDADIARARALPAELYTSPAWHTLIVEHVFMRCWQPVPGAHDLDAEGSRAVPFTLLDGCLGEPLVLTRSAEGEVHCLSNVCTHRGATMVDEACALRLIRCPYHGRRFKLDGRIVAAPRFGKADQFPSDADNLRKIPMGRWGSFAFVGMDPRMPFEDWIAPVQAGLDFVPPEELVFDALNSGTYELDANWMVYVDHLLEGYHLPHVHPEVAELLDLRRYQTFTYDWGALQVAHARAPNDGLRLPPSHPRAQGGAAAMLKFWLFPNVFLTLHTWGLVLRLAEPLGQRRTRVSWWDHIWDVERRGVGVARQPAQVEEQVRQAVLRAWRGVQSHTFAQGRYSPDNEAGVHHFHRVLANVLNEGRRSS